LERFAQGAGLPPSERAFARALADGVLRRRAALDWALNRFARPSVEKLDPDVRAALRLGAYQILFASGRVPAYAAVNESVALVKKGHGGRASFVNAVLRSLERGRERLPWPAGETPEALSVRFSHPPWLIERWLARLGPAETVALLEKNNTPPALTLRVNTLKTTREKLLARLAAEGASAEPSALSPEGLRLKENAALETLGSFQDGEFFVQDEASQLVTHVLDPKPGEKILDLCAAPGGKTTHIAQRLENRGAVAALDNAAPKLKFIEENIRRLGATCVKMEILDAREAPARYTAWADRVLLDAPCSNLGVLRRRPDARWNKDYAKILKTLPALQRALLNAAAACVKPGGAVVYSTCTTEPEENEQVLRAFLAENAAFVQESVAPWVPEQLKREVSAEGALRLWPHRHDTDGFFIARLKRKK